MAATTGTLFGVFGVSDSTGVLTPKQIPIIPTAVGGLFLVNPDGTLTTAQIIAAIDAWRAYFAGAPRADAGGNAAGTTLPAPTAIAMA